MRVALTDERIERIYTFGSSNHFLHLLYGPGKEGFAINMKF